MPRITVNIPQESKDFLTNYIIFEDAAKNQSEAVNWCIDSCIKIEKKYGVDACYVAHHEDFADKKVIAFGEFAATHLNPISGKYNVDAFEKKEGPQLMTPIPLTFNTTEQVYEWWVSVIWKGKFQ